MPEDFSWDNYDPNSDSNPDVQVTPPETPAAPPDPELMANARSVWPIFKAAGAAGSEPWFGNNYGTDVDSGKAGAGVVDKGAAASETLMQKLAKELGFTSQNDFAKAMVPAASTLVGAAISGAASGYAASQRHVIDKQLADSQVATNAASAALARSRANQAGLAGLKFTPGPGMINAPFKPTPLVSPSQRAVV